MLARSFLRSFRTAYSACSSTTAFLSEAADAAVNTAPGATDVPRMPEFDYQPPQYDGPDIEQVISMRERFLNPAIFHYYKEPLMLTHGRAQYLFDHNGRRYLDAFAGIVTVSVGHCHPTVVQAMQQQENKLMHTTSIYLNPELVLYAKELSSKLPPELDSVYVVNSGSEANDLAMMMARVYTGSETVVGLRSCYHGMSIGTMGVTALHTWRYPIAPTGHIVHALTPDPYRGLMGDRPDPYVQDLENLIQSSTCGKVAAFIHESMQGMAGAVEFMPGYLSGAYKATRAAGGLCIADEVQTGFGRTGDHFWGFQTQDVIPDIVTMAKGIGNGYPMAAVVTRREIAECMKQRLHFNTFGGNPVAASAGRAVLRVIEEEHLQNNCLVVGETLKEELLKLMEKHDIIGNVRGRGLMLGMELVKDRESKVPAKEEFSAVMEKMRELGVLVGRGGFYGTTFRIKPPMCFTMEDAKFLVQCFDHALSRL